MKFLYAFLFTLAIALFMPQSHAMELTEAKTSIATQTEDSYFPEKNQRFLAEQETKRIIEKEKTKQILAQTKADQVAVVALNGLPVIGMTMCVLYLIKRFNDTK